MRRANSMANTLSILALNRAIHEPARFAIMVHLYVVSEADFVMLARQTGLSAGNLSSHMAKLEEAGYVDVKKTFSGKRPQTIYRLTKLGRTEFERYRSQVANALNLD